MFSLLYADDTFIYTLLELYYNSNIIRVVKESGEVEMLQDEVREVATWITQDLKEEEGFVPGTMGEPLEDFK